MIPNRRTNVTYANYCLTLDLIAANLAEGKETAGIFGDIGTAIIPLIKNLVEEFKIGFKDVISALKNRDIFQLFKAVRWNLGTLVKAVMSAGKLINVSLKAVFKQIEQHEWIQKIKTGAAKVDDLLNAFPILKKLAGPLLAGFLLFMWIKMSFIGDFEYDFDLSDIVNAFTGKFSIHDLFATASGLQNVALFVLGISTGLGFTWLIAHTGFNLLVGIFYTQFKHTGQPKFAKQFFQRMQHQASVKSISSPGCNHTWIINAGKKLCAECGADYFKSSGFQYP